MSVLFAQVAPGPNAVTPEPSTLIIWAVLAIGGIAFGWWRKRKAG